MEIQKGQQQRFFKPLLYLQNCLELSSRGSGSTWLQMNLTIYADLLA